MDDAEPDVNSPCVGCGRVTLVDAKGNPVEGHGSAMVNFSGSLFHAACFKCSKCRSPIDFENNVVLLEEDGKALCVDCAYKCKGCGEPILEEALTTGDDTYHTDCFRCAQCNNPIGDGSFVHVDDKLWCTDCERSTRSASADSLDDLPEVPPRPTGRGLTKDGSAASSLASISGITRDEYVLQLERELEDRSRQLSTSEANMAKFKATSKKAVEEFRQLAQAQASETARRHGAEARVMALQAQLAEVTRAETQRARSEAQLERLSREVQFLQTQRDASQKEVTELESKRQALALELGELAENRVGRDEAVSATASEIDSRRANELSYDLAQIKERFRSDVTALQTQREGMSREVAELRREREALHDEMTNLREETRKLEVSRRHISEDLIQSAEQLDAAPRTAYPEMEELARTVSIGDALGSTGDAKRLPLPPPRAPSRLLGPREDARRASETSRRLTEPALDFSATFAGAGAGSPGGRRDKWTKDWKTNLKATKTKLKNAIPQKALGPQGLDGAPDGGGSGNSLLTYGGNMFKIGAKNKSVSKSDGDLTRAVPPIPPKNDDVRPTHSFQPHSYRSPRKCNLCNDKLWGRELRCEGCGYHCHNKCAPSVIGQCFASNGEPTSVLFTAPTDATHQTFGIPLDKLLEREGGTVPKIVIKCIAAVEYRGMSAEGIYRKSGPLTQINKILAAVERGEDVDLMTETHDVDITAITSLLKQFFRDLPDPLLTTTLYSAWTAVFRGSDDPGATMTQVVELLKLLPPNNLTTLAYLALHLDRIQQHSTENLMTPTNIGVVFGPSLLRPEEQETQLDLAESSAKNAVIEFLVRNARKLFAAGEETEGAPAVDGDEEGEEIEGDEEDSSGVDRTVEEDVEKEGQTVDGVAVDRISEPRLRPRMGSPTTRVSEKPPVVVFNGINLQQS